MNSSIVKLVLVLSTSFCILHALAGDVYFNNERSDLIELRDSLRSTMNLHSNWTGPPCFGNRSRWFGITCWKSRVVAVVLPEIQLTGTLSPTALQNLSHLTYLNLSNNALHGELPDLRSLRMLREVSFAGNRFSGSIPTDFVNLSDLSRLELQDNLLTGAIPPFDQQSLEVFNVSNNLLEGRIPDTPGLRTFSVSSFSNNPELCGSQVDKVCSGTAADDGRPAGAGGPKGTISATVVRGTNRLRLWTIVGIVVATCWVLYMVVVGVWFSHNNHHNRLNEGKERTIGGVEDEGRDELEFIHKESSSFNLNDLLGSSAEILGKGKLGSTYKTTLPSGPVIAVKRLREMDDISCKEFAQQMRLLGRLRHENLVEIISFYHSQDQKLVLYEHVPARSLFELLHENRGEGRVPLKWAARLQIVKQIAKGLTFLHQSLPSVKVPHANLKSSNILVHHEEDDHRPLYHVKLTEYGFQPLFSCSHYLLKKLAVAKSPEFSQGKKLTPKVDVFCFGLILMEVITGNILSDRDDESLHAWARSVLSSWSMEVLDLELVAESHAHGEMRKLAEIAVFCTESEPERRPKMSQVMERIWDLNETCIEIEELLV